MRIHKSILGYLDGIFFNHKLRVRTIVTILILALHVAVYVWIWRCCVPINRVDFTAFYAATRLWQQGNNPYALSAQCEIVESINDGGCLPMAHPPLLLPLLSLIIDDDYVASYERWCAILIVVIALCLIPLYHISPSFDRAVVALTFTPTFLSLILGQDTPFVLLGVLLFVEMLLRKRDLLAGIALGLTMVKPQIAILLALPLFYCRRKAFAGFIAVGFLLIVYSWALVGTQGFSSLTNLVAVLAKGEGYGIKTHDMPNSAGLLAEANINRVWIWVVFAVAIILISVLWKKYNVSTVSLALACVITVFASPHLHRQDLVLLAFPLVISHSAAPAIAAALLLTGLLLNVTKPEALLIQFILAIHLFKKLAVETKYRERIG